MKKLIEVPDNAIAHIVVFLNEEPDGKAGVSSMVSGHYGQIADMLAGVIRTTGHMAASRVGGDQQFHARGIVEAVRSKILENDAENINFVDLGGEDGDGDASNSGR